VWVVVVVFVLVFAADGTAAFVAPAGVAASAAPDGMMVAAPTSKVIEIGLRMFFSFFVRMVGLADPARGRAALSLARVPYRSAW
jgi:hypothetical protein